MRAPLQVMRQLVVPPHDVRRLVHSEAAPARVAHFVVAAGRGGVGPSHWAGQSPDREATGCMMCEQWRGQLLEPLFGQVTEGDTACEPTPGASQAQDVPAAANRPKVAALDDVIAAALAAGWLEGRGAGPRAGGEAGGMRVSAQIETMRGRIGQQGMRSGLHSLCALSAQAPLTDLQQVVAGLVHVIEHIGTHVWIGPGVAGGVVGAPNAPERVLRRLQGEGDRGELQRQGKVCISAQS